MQKGYGASEIADALEEDGESVEKIMKALNACGVDASDEDVYNYMQKND